MELRKDRPVLITSKTEGSVTAAQSAGAQSGQPAAYTKIPRTPALGPQAGGILDGIFANFFSSSRNIWPRRGGEFAKSPERSKKTGGGGGGGEAKVEMGVRPWIHNS